MAVEGSLGVVLPARATTGVDSDALATLVPAATVEAAMVVVVRCTFVCGAGVTVVAIASVLPVLVGAADMLAGVALAMLVNLPAAFV